VEPSWEIRWSGFVRRSWSNISKHSVAVEDWCGKRNRNEKYAKAEDDIFINGSKHTHGYNPTEVYAAVVRRKYD
jgi:hypothetical protein